MTLAAPELQIACFELGKLYLKLKRFDDALKLFTALSNADSNNPEYLYYQGEALRELDQIAGSLVAYKNAVAIDSTHLKSLFQLGKYFVGKQEKSEALKYIDQGLRTYSNAMALINLKALAFFNNDEFAKARPFFEKLLALGEEKPHVYAKLAYCYYRVWEFEKAKKTYHRLIAIDDEDPDPYFNLAHVFLKDRQIDSARFYLKKSMAVQTPNFNREFSSLANIASGENDLKSALYYYNLAFKEEGSDYRSYYQICNIVDQTSTDPKEKLAYYEGFVEKFGTEVPYLSEIVKTRIFALKQEIHFAGNR